jgi:integrase
LRVSEAIALRWGDLELGAPAGLWVRRAIVRGVVGACASMLVEAGASPLRLQRWMGHHSAAYTLDVYGHLLEEKLGPGLDLEAQLGDGPTDRTPP